MRKFAMAMVAAAAFMIPAAASAETSMSGATELSSQVSVRVGPGHGRFHSRRADRKRCRTVRITEKRPSGRIVRKVVKRCD